MFPFIVFLHRRPQNGGERNTDGEGEPTAKKGLEVAPRSPDSRNQIIKEMEASEKDFLTVKEAAFYLNLAKGYLYKLMMRKAIPYYKPMGKKCYFKRSDLNEWINAGRIATDAETSQQAERYCIANLK